LFKSLAIAFCHIRWVHRIDSCSSVCLSLSNKSLVRSLGNSLSFQLARASRSFFCSLFRCATHYTSFLACPSAPRTLPRLPDSTSLSQTRFPWVDLFCTLPELTLYSAREIPPGTPAVPSSHRAGPPGVAWRLQPPPPALGRRKEQPSLHGSSP